MNRLFRVKQGIICELFVVLVAASFLIYDKVSERTLATIGQTSEVGVTPDTTGEENAGTSEESNDLGNQNTDQADSSKEEEKKRINMMLRPMKTEYMLTGLNYLHI